MCGKYEYIKIYVYDSDSGSGLQCHSQSSPEERSGKFSQNGKFGWNGKVHLCFICMQLHPYLWVHD